MSPTEDVIAGGLTEGGVGAVAGNASAAPGDSLLRGVRRLAALADRVTEPEQVFRVLARELGAAIGAEEVHVHHFGGQLGLRDQSPLEAQRLDAHSRPTRHSQRELVVVYLNEGEGRLSYLCAESERPPAVSWVASTGRSFLAAGERELLAGLPGLTSGPAAARSALLAPLQVRGRMLAVVVLVARDPVRFDERSVEQAAALVDQAATMLALMKARAEAGTDAVTGCMNHRAMRRRLREEVVRAERSAGRLSCLLIDLDDFKLVNDRHGHQAGDEVLRKVADTLMREFRAFDRVARYGGDEFVVILPETDLESALAAAERALERLREIAVGRVRAPGVHASIGVAEWAQTMSVEDLLEACDAALLQGKREGKRRVTPAR
ncbi:MAG TPA: sensor domain-containing diguanylate cyclase [Solirubrobacteraceae bacterium]|jgi:diguanylate cyclase (GGDEF)-like protein